MLPEFCLLTSVLYVHDDSETEIDDVFTDLIQTPILGILRVGLAGETEGEK